MKPFSTLEFAITGLIQQRPQSGYDLRKTFGTTAMRHYSDSPGSIYPALRRVEARGWVSAQPPRTDEAENPRRRQAFALTEAGRKALVAWIEQPLSHQDVVLRAHELMLRFAFMDGNVPRSVACRFLADFEREHGAYVTELRRQYDEMRSIFPLHTGVLAFESGIVQMEAQLSWARQARDRLEKSQ